MGKAETSEISDAITDPYEKVKDAINQAEILTYEVKKATVTRNYLRALFDMARLAVITGMDATAKAVDDVKDAVAKKIHSNVKNLPELAPRRCPAEEIRGCLTFCKR